MTRDDTVRRIRQKIVKLHVYFAEAEELYGKAIAGEMFAEDLDFYVGLLIMIGEGERN